MASAGAPYRLVPAHFYPWFNLYTNDLPVTRSRRFTYVDDICRTLQVETFSKITRKNKSV